MCIGGQSQSNGRVRSNKIRRSLRRLGTTKNPNGNDFKLHSIGQLLSRRECHSHQKSRQENFIAAHLHRFDQELIHEAPDKALDSGGSPTLRSLKGGILDCRSPEILHRLAFEGIVIPRLRKTQGWPPLCLPQKTLRKNQNRDPDSSMATGRVRTQAIARLRTVDH